MPEFARGLILEIPDRDQFEEFVLENAHDPGAQTENWGHNSVPESIHIYQYSHDDDDPYYRTYDKHVNGEVSWNYWSDELLNAMLDAGVLKNTGNYDVEFVEEQDD